MNSSYRRTFRTACKRYGPGRLPGAERHGVGAGYAAATAAYLVTLVFVGTVLTTAAALSLSGAEPVSAAAFSWGLVYFAFVFTWWVAIPVGCLGGAVYLHVVETEV